MTILGNNWHHVYFLHKETVIWRDTVSKEGTEMEENWQYFSATLELKTYDEKKSAPKVYRVCNTEMTQL